MTIIRQAVLIAASLGLAASVGGADGDGSSVQGFIYGTVETRDGKIHTGVLRWDDEEAFWDDLFHSSKTQRLYQDYEEPAGADDDAPWWERMAKAFGADLGLVQTSRIIAVRFGDLRGVRPTGGTSAVLLMKDGTEIEVEGHANDVGASIRVLDAKPGSIEVQWKQIKAVDFAATPPEVDPASFRLHGTVSTSRGDFVGFIQWDNEESLSTDRLDGDVDGDRISIEMGEIRSIERRDRRSSKVVLRDGNEMVLSGTNDVNDDIRGIHVEDLRFGRVEIGWDQFERVTFDDPGASGLSYDEYPPPSHLSGTVTLRNGDWRSGRLVFDLDEEWSWEMLDGGADGIEYTIPFAMVASVEPDRGSGCRVLLRSGLELELAGSHDVDRDNSGVVVIPKAGGNPAHVPWAEIAEITFD